MTRLPLDNRNVKGLPGKSYVANAYCPIPGCEIISRGERHHIWRRSFLGGDFWYVVLPDGEVLGNCVWLCNEHHRMITENGAKLEYVDGRVYYTDLYNVKTELLWQPPFWCSQDAWYTDRILGIDPVEPDLSFENSQEKIEGGSEWSSKIAASHSTSEGASLTLVTSVSQESETPSKSATRPTETSASAHNECPTCHRPLPRPKVETPKEQKKIRKSWSVAVPVTEQENGAEVMDELLEAARDELARGGLPYGDTDAAKYYVISTSLALFVQHAREVL